MADPEADTRPPFDDQVLPCGCLIRFDEATKEMLIYACRSDCQYVRAALQMADDAGKPSEVRYE